MKKTHVELQHGQHIVERGTKWAILFSDGPQVPAQSPIADAGEEGLPTLDVGRYCWKHGTLKFPLVESNILDTGDALPGRSTQMWDISRA